MSQSLSALSAALEAARTGGSLTITAGQTGVPALDAFLATLPARSLTLEQTQVQYQDSQRPATLVVSGELSGSWPLPGLSSTLAGSAATISFAQGGAEAAVTAGLMVSATLRAGGQTLALTGSLASPGPGLNPGLTFEWLPGQLGRLSLGEVATLATEGRAEAALPTGVALFDNLELSFFKLTFGYAAGTPMVMQFGLATDQDATWEIVPGQHTLRQMRIIFAASCRPSSGGSRSSYGGYIVAKLDIGQPLLVTVGLQPGHAWQVDVVASEGLPALADLASLFGVQDQVRSALQAAGLGDITLTAVRLGIDRTAGTLSYVSMQGALSFAGKVFNLRLQLPDFQFSGTLSDATPMSLTELLEHMIGDASGLPDVVIDELSLWCSPATESYSLIANIADDAISADGHRLGDVMLQLERQGSSVTGTLGATLSIAGSQIVITGGYGAGWVLAGEIDNLSLSALLADVLPDVPLPGLLADVCLSQATVTWNQASGSFAFDGSVDLSLDLGPLLVPTTLTLAVTSTAGQGAIGSLTGSLTLGGVVFSLLYEFQPGQQVLRGTWTSQGTADFAALALAFGIRPPTVGITLPDLSFTSLSFDLDLSSAGQQAVYLTATTALGQAFFLVERPSHGQPWAFVFGAGIDHATKLSDLLAPLGLDSQALDFITLGGAFFLVSSAQFPALQVPGFSPLGGQPMPVSVGATAVMLLDLAGTPSQPDVTTLRSLLPGNPAVLTAELCVGTSAMSTAVIARLAGDLTIAAGDASSLTLSNASVMLWLDPAAIGLNGSIVIPLGDQQLEATGMLTVSATELTASLAVAGTSGQVLPFPMGFAGVHLTDLSVQVGATFEPPAVALGVLGRFVVGPGDPPPAGTAVISRPLTAMPPPSEFVMIIGIEGELPNPMLLSMYLQELSLADAIAAFINQRVSLPDVLTDIRATDLMIYWCDVPAGIQQPDGTWAYPGFGFNCTLDLYGFLAHAEMKIASGSGITGIASISPVRIDGVLNLTGDGQGTPPGYQGQVTVQPGGPQVQVSTLGSPYLDLDWRLTLFSTVSRSVNAQVTTEGLTFEVTDAGPGFSSSLQCSLRMPLRLQMTFSVAVDLDVDLGTLAGVNLGTLRLGDTGLDATLLAATQPAFSLALNGSFEVDGVGYTLPELSVTVAFSSLADIPEAIADQISQDVEATFAPLYDSAAAYASLAQQGIVTGADEIGSVLNSAYDLTAQQAAATMKDVDYAVDDVAQAFKYGYDATGQEAAQLLRTAGYGATEVTGALQQVWDVAADTAASYLKAVGYSLDDISTSLQSVYDLGSSALQQALSYAGYAESEIESAFNSLGEDLEDVENYFKDWW